MKFYQLFDEHGWYGNVLYLQMPENVDYAEILEVTLIEGIKNRKSSLIFYYKWEYNHILDIEIRSKK